MDGKSHHNHDGPPEDILAHSMGRCCRCASNYKNKKKQEECFVCNSESLHVRVLPGLGRDVECQNEQAETNHEHKSHLRFMAQQDDQHSIKESTHEEDQRLHDSRVVCCVQLETIEEGGVPLGHSHIFFN